MAELVKLQVDRLYYDLGEVEVIASTYLEFLNSLARGCKCLGVEMVCIHMRPGTAFALANLQDPRFDFATQRTISFD